MHDVTNACGAAKHTRRSERMNAMLTHVAKLRSGKFSDRLAYQPERVEPEG